MACLCRHWREAAVQLRPIHNQALEEVGCSDAMLQPLCTRQKPSINFTADWMGLGAGLGVRNMSLPPGSYHLAHSDSQYRRNYYGHRENIVTVIRVFRPWIREKFFIRRGKFVFGRLPVPVCVKGTVITVRYFEHILQSYFRNFRDIFFQTFHIYFFHTFWNLVFILSKLCCLLLLLVYNNGKSVSWSRILFPNNILWVCLKQWQIGISWRDVVLARGILNYLFYLIIFC
jgi:hypothetical protein